MLTLVNIIILLSILWSYIRWNNVKKYWKNRGVLHYSPHPLFGSLTFLHKRNPVFWMRQIYNDFKSPYIGIWLFWRPALVINCPKIGKRILTKDSENFRNRLMSSGKSDPIGSMSLSTLKDPVWWTVRRKLTSVFSATKLKYHTKVTQVKSNDLIERLKEGSSKNICFNLRSLCADYTTDVIGESAYGIISESTKTGDSVLRSITREVMTFNLFRGLSWFSIFFFPELVDIFRFSFFPKGTVERFRVIFNSTVEHRGGFNRKVKDPQDLLDALIKMKQEWDGEEMSEDFLLAQVFAFLLGGFDTSAATMSWIIYELAWHPHYQQKLYKEILNVKRECGEKDLDTEALSKLTYLNCVIKETLRLFPPMGWLDRVAAKDYKIDENLTIPAGMPVYVNGIGMQTDPQFFADPYVFNPDRFLPDNEKNMTPFTYLPFGEGPRSCVGMRLAYQTLKQAIASILLTFEVQTLPNTPRPGDVQTENKGIFYMPLDDRMVVKFVIREKA